MIMLALCNKHLEHVETLDLKLWQDITKTTAQVMDRVVCMVEDWKMANAVTATQKGPHTTQQNSDNINLTATPSHASDKLQK